VLCSSAEETKEALERIVASGLRPTIRSGGHCYEDFVANNPGGAIIDVNMHNKVTADDDGTNVRIAPGAVLGDVYRTLYKGYGITIPAGSCYRVGAGGHIGGGGYGVLSRLLGLTVDWLTGVDILTVDEHGKVVERHVDKEHDADLFRACRGAGGGNFGLINNYHFAKLPAAPTEVASAGISFAWSDMTLEKFTKILIRYGEYWEGCGQDPDTWGMFIGMGLGMRSEKGHFGFGGQFCNPDGTAKDLSVLHEFFDRFSDLDPAPVAPKKSMADFHSSDPAKHAVVPVKPADGDKYYTVDKHLWIDATVGDGGGSGGARSKYKSAYMKKTFTTAECAAIYKWLTSEEGQKQGGMILVNSYGGAVNKPERISDTAIAQRSSVMKLQWISSWSDKAEDDARVAFLNNFYKDIYTGDHVPPEYQGTPFGPRYEGCYMNYADAYMLNYSYWPQLYYGNGDLYPFLQKVKKKYDPNNIFHSSMSIRS